MSNITNYLFERAGGLITRSPEVRDNESKGYEMADTGAVEVEVGEFLYGLTRLIKPLRILTTGIYTGISDMYIAQGLKDNGNGGFITAFEINETHLKRAQELWLRTDTSGIINPFLMKSLDFTPDKTYQLMFLDSEPDIRFKELVKFYPNLEEGGFVGIHDLHNHMGQETIDGHQQFWPWGEMPSEMKDWITQGDLKPWYFPNPRGMVMFQKKKRGEKPDYV